MKTLTSLFLCFWVAQSFALGGSGTKCRPYLIASADDFAEFADITNFSANQGEEVSGKLTADITTTQAYTFNPGKELFVFLDLNGYTITQNAANAYVLGVGRQVTLEITANGGGLVNNAPTPSSGTESRQTIKTTENSNLIVEGGTFVCNSTTSSIYINGKASIRNATISNFRSAISLGKTATAELIGCTTSSTGDYAVYNEARNTKIIGGAYTNNANISTIGVYYGSMDITDAWVRNTLTDAGSLKRAVFTNASTSLTINSGIFESYATDATVYGSSSITINGGEFKNHSSIGGCIKNTAGNKLNGGTANGKAIANSTSFSFCANGGTGSMPVQIITADGALDHNTFTRAGYNFCGWNTKVDGSGTPYTDGQNVTYTAGASFTLYAQWEKPLSLNEDPDHKGSFYTTFYNSGTAFALPENVTAYKGSISQDERTIHLEATQEGYLPKGEPVILRSNTRSIALKPVSSTTSKDEHNALEGVDSQKTQSAYGEGTYYMLSYGQNGLGLYKMNADTQLGAGKAFLRLSGDSGAANAKAFIFSFGDDDEESAIPVVEAEESSSLGQKQTYNLSGQMVKRPTKGIFISGGKKITVK